jgi:hypothetical protein
LELVGFFSAAVTCALFVPFRHWADQTYPPFWLNVMTISALLLTPVHPWKWIPQPYNRWMSWANRALLVAFLLSIIVPLLGMAWAWVVEVPAIRVLTVVYQGVSIIGWTVGLYLLLRLVRAVEKK